MTTETLAMQTIRDLCDLYEHPVSEGTLREYLEELTTWTKLSDLEWTELKRTARRRYDHFPRISQLYEIYLELLHCRPYPKLVKPKDSA